MKTTSKKMKKTSTNKDDLKKNEKLRRPKKNEGDF